MNKKVLIVEDNELIAFLHKKFVKDCGAEVVGTTCDFEEFIDLINDTQPDVILMDILLGQEMDGIDFVLGAPSSNARVYYVSASTDPATLEKAKQTKFHAFVVKPLSLATLKEMLDF
ncbi:hypothetical protein CJD36_005560 [Flavipsychrobacter stenotrophus]|uniref:Response regulatory domain-containing protein n=1 Tax=Flavipsychrobacter stenotrophus TaxID=2077091 RepID=A0A2S7SXC4_9BACT|nr:response regulator [Flavipsychrobacter stenotrophus]PQJ11271.1 hypothetical protein CJD36_005560 [Flavipsychrobacter stenotrophus]